MCIRDSDITVGTGTIFNLNAKTLTSSGNINVNSGGELDILSSATVSAQLLIGATKTLTNNGCLLYTSRCV